jgi:hypothetical protein
MTPKQAEKVRILRAKIEADLPIKPSEWPAWQRNAGKGWEWTPAYETRNEATMRHEYLAAMGIKDEADANPCAIYWDAYHARETGIRCDTCGRPGLEWCQSCRNWLQRISDRKRIRIVTPQVHAA